MVKHLPCPVSECTGEVVIDESAPPPPRLQWPVTCSPARHPLWLDVFQSGGYALARREEGAWESLLKAGPSERD